MTETFGMNQALGNHSLTRTQWTDPRTILTHIDNESPMIHSGCLVCKMAIFNEHLCEYFCMVYVYLILLFIFSEPIM